MIDNLLSRSKNLAVRIENSEGDRFVPLKISFHMTFFLLTTKQTQVQLNCPFPHQWAPWLVRANVYRGEHKLHQKNPSKQSLDRAPSQIQAFLKLKCFFWKATVVGSDCEYPSKIRHHRSAHLLWVRLHSINFKKLHTDPAMMLNCPSKATAVIAVWNAFTANTWFFEAKSMPCIP